MSSPYDMRLIIDRVSIVESRDLAEINWRKSLAAATAAGMMAGSGVASAGMPDTTALNNLPSVTKSIGGWYPVFFDQYSVEKIDQIVDNYQSGKIKDIRVIYDENSALAGKIVKNLNTLTGAAVKQIHQPNIDTPNTQYDHNRVVVEIH